MRVQRCPLILAYSVTPAQTYHFKPDVFYDVTDVMPAYVDLIGRIEAIRTGARSRRRSAGNSGRSPAGRRCR